MFGHSNRPTGKRRGAAGKGRPRRKGRRRGFEPLEPRWMLSADSTVVFNEVMYHPAGTNQDLEWVELHNQMTVDMDLSGWSLDEAIEFQFEPGTVIPGGGYLVIAKDPPALQAATGFADAQGPYEGRLSNGGEWLVLRNNNDRLMDELDYGDRQPWPVAPDGSGASLAKYTPLSPSGPAANWRASAQIGGTPGQVNFAESGGPTFDQLLAAGADARAVIPGDDALGMAWTEVAFTDSTWQEGTTGVGYETESSDPLSPPVQRYYPLEGDAEDRSGQGVDGAVSGARFSADVPAELAPGQSLDFDGTNDLVEVLDAFNPTAYTLSVWAKLDSVRACSIIVRTSSSGPTTHWSHQICVDSAGRFEHYIWDGSQRTITGSTVVQAGQWYHVAAVATDGGLARLYVNGVEEGTAQGVGSMWTGGDRWQLGTSSGHTPSFLDGHLDDVAIWHEALSENQIGQLASGGSPLALGGYASLIGLDVQQAMFENNASAYVRMPFMVGNPNLYDQLTLGMKYDDGFVAYLNGVEVAHRNAPEVAAWNAHATAEHPDVEAAVFESIDVTPYLASLRAGANLLAIHGLNLSAPDPDFLIVPELSARRSIVSADDLVINEVAAATDQPFWIELYNSGATEVDLENYVLRCSAGDEHLFGAETLESGRYLVLDETRLGFRVAAGANLFLFAPGETRVVDAVSVDDVLCGRTADAPGGPLLFPSAATPGSANRFAFHDEIVINEIMYHHRPDFGEPFAEVDEEWIELYNRSDRLVDLGGWRLADAVDFEFAAGTALQPDEHLVVSNDAAALAARYPEIEIAGDFSRELNNKRDRIVLLDAAGNPADEVLYYDDDPWPRFADGGGSSLELRDPRADNRRTDSWAASDEAAKASWQHYAYTMTAVAPVYSPTLYSFHELRMGLVSDGEALIDNVTVVEDPGGSGRQLIQNSSFSSGFDRWREYGNHSHSEVITDPENPGNKVLHLVATGPTSYLDNRTETTLKADGALVPVVTGRQYQISFDAKWLGGSPQLHTELYYNKVVRTTILEIPDLHGTPGARNSTFEANVGPTYSGLAHSPAVPQAGEPITVCVTADDPDGVDVMTLWYAVSGGSWQGVPMTAGAGGRYTGLIPGLGSGTVIQFYVVGADDLGATSACPAAGPNSRALIKVDDGRAVAGKQNFRIIMTAAEATLLHEPLNILSNDRLGATIVYNENEVFYDAGIRLRGSMWSRHNPSGTGFNVKFPADHLFRGIHATVTLKRPAIIEILVKHMNNQAGGIPGMYDDVVNLISHRSDNMGSARLSMARYNDVYLDSQFENGSQGTMFKMEGIRVVQGTHNGDPEGLKLAFPIGWIYGYDICNLGDDQEQYRWSTLINNNRDRDDYSGYIAMAKAFSLSGTALEQAAAETMDVDQWMRVFAMASLAGIGDMYTQGNPHNCDIYVRPEDGKAITLPWDWDFTFNRSTTAPLWGNKNLAKIISRPVYTRLFHGHLYDLINTTYNTAYMARWIDHYGQVAGQNFSGASSYINSRSSYVLGRLPAQFPFEITTNGGNDFSVDDVAVTIQGRGWINVREIRLAGQPEPLQVTWLDHERWQVTLPVAFGPNTFDFEAYDPQGQLVGSDRITVTSTDSQRPLETSLRITEINYHPADPTDAERAEGFTDDADFEFIELQNVGDQTLDLTGAQFTRGIDFDFFGRTLAGQVMITEVGTGDPDYVEIQNLSGNPVDTSGWFVVVNDAYDVGHPPDINAWHATRWLLPASMAADEVLYRSDMDDHTGNYWGNNIFWRTDGNGWVMLVDEAGEVADFVVWGYDPDEIASLEIDVQGMQLTLAGAWSGAAVPPDGETDNSLQRRGTADHDDASDWDYISPQSKGAQNNGLTVPFTTPFDLEPGQFVVIARNAAAIEARYGSQVIVAGRYRDKLSNGGERVTLAYPSGIPILDFAYGDSQVPGWPGRADGKGASLELIDPTAVPLADPQRTAYLENAANWRSSSEYGGSPGLAGSGPLGDVVVNEVLTHTDLPELDTIELHNATDDPIDVGGWYLSHDWGWDPTGVDGNYRRFRIPEGTSIPAHGYAVFDEDDFNPSWNDPEADPGPNDFALSGAHGDDVWVMEADAAGELKRFVDHVEFGAAASGESRGRWPNGQGDLYPMSRPTLDKAHPERGRNTGPRVGPVIISELHYNPKLVEEDDDLEFVEICNTTSRPIDLTEWRIRGGIDYDFPAGITLGPHGAVVVLPFDVDDADRWSAFCAEYGLSPAETEGFLGGYSDRLDDDGGRVQLQRPDEEPPDEPGFIPRLLEDEVRYDDENPWPVDADGGGHSLQRRASACWGNDSGSWAPMVPTPAAVEIVAQVVGRHLFYNGSRFDGYDPGANVEDDRAIAPDKQALLPGQSASFANYTGYSRGINGIMVDLQGMPAGAVPEADDFQFRVGNGTDPGGWAAAPPPSTFAVRPGDGTNGSDRVTIIWADNSIQKQWLQVTVLATADTGLGDGDVFYFGNAIGETGNSAGDAKVNAFDMLGSRDNQRTFLHPAPIDFVYDFNRDARVNTYDMLIARDNQTHFLNALRLITVPATRAGEGVGRVEARDPRLRSQRVALSRGSRASTHPTVSSGITQSDSSAAANPAELQEAAAHDAVLGQGPGWDSEPPGVGPGRWDWLWEVEEMISQKQSPKKDCSTEAVTDRLLTGG